MDGEIVWMMKEEELLSLFDGNEAVVSSCKQYSCIRHDGISTSGVKICLHHD